MTKTSNHQSATAPSSSVTIWVGGTSALAQTYLEEIPRYLDQQYPKSASRRLILAARRPPKQKNNRNRSHASYLELDMAQTSSIDRFFDRLQTDEAVLFGPATEPNTRTSVTIVFGMRSSLVTGSPEEHVSLTKHLGYFLDKATSTFSTTTTHDKDNRRNMQLAGVLHVSSVAVMDHTRPQSMLTERAPLPPLKTYSSPYDWTKRTAEDVLTTACRSLHIPSCVHLRISGIFSNEVPPTQCIQMGAIRLQAYAGSYLTTPLDMNTGRNVCQAMRLILERMDETAAASDAASDSFTHATSLSRDSASTSRIDNVGTNRVSVDTPPAAAQRPPGDGNHRVAIPSSRSVQASEGWAHLVLWAVILFFRWIASLHSSLGTAMRPMLERMEDHPRKTPNRAIRSTVLVRGSVEPTTKPPSSSKATNEDEDDPLVPYRSAWLQDNPQVIIRDSDRFASVYFYTRPTIAPRAYGDNLVAYRSANNISYAADIPERLVRPLLWAIILLFGWVASFGRTLVVRNNGSGSSKWLSRGCDVLANVSYLLTVSVVEHTFDNSKIRRDFPELNPLEESVPEGFVRIRNRRLERYNHAVRKHQK